MSEFFTPTRPVPQPGALRIAPYVPGSAGEPNAQGKLHKLSSNEAPHGPSPEALAVDFH